MTSKTENSVAGGSDIERLKRGDVWLANLNPQKGGEPGKTRPVLVVQSQTLLDVGHPTTIIIPLTTNLIDDAYPLRVRIRSKEKLEKDSDLLIDQVRAIDNARLRIGPLTHIEPRIMRQIDNALAEVVGIGT
jgi:mRNA interferase MazF